MPDRTLITETYGSVLLAPEVPCPIVQWYAFANRQQFRFSMDRSQELYSQEHQRTRPLGLLGDTRRFGAVTLDDQRWLRTNWSLRPYAADIRHMGCVAPGSIFDQISVQSYTDNTEAANAINIAHYTTLPEAKQWLHQALQEPAVG